MKSKPLIIILGVETSCDETSAAVVEVTSFKLPVTRFKILSNVIWSQIQIHQKYGGVVPEVAARNHVKNIIPVVDLALRRARVTARDIDRIAVTHGPGLITSLLVGVEAARTLACVWKKPLVGVDHIKGHVYSAWLPSREFSIFNFQFPMLALVVSGGHTELLFMKNIRSFKKIGQTLDDAAGEAFDKVAKMLGLGFPGGPEISKLAKKGNPEAFDFPRPMKQSGDFNFSFSGLKTSVLYTLKDNPPYPPLYKGGKEGGLSKKLLADFCASFQQAVVDVLVFKTIQAAKEYKVKTLILGGGVAANILLRETLKHQAEKFDITFIVPEIKLCTDNAAPIAVAGYFGKPMPWQKISVEPQLERE